MPAPFRGWMIVGRRQQDAMIRHATKTDKISQGLVLDQMEWEAITIYNRHFY